jgi:hypothetical protein
MGVAVDQHRLHDVAEDRARHPAERVEEPFVRLDQRSEPFVAGEPDERQPAEAQRADEGRQLVPAAPDRRPVRLRLPPGRGLRTIGGAGMAGSCSASQSFRIEIPPS